MERFSKTDISRLCRYLDEAASVAILGHMSPDGDALGSALGLSHVLTAMGKEAKVIMPDQPTLQLAFLPGYRDIIVYDRYKEFAEGVIARADVVFCLDFNALSRIDWVGPAVSKAFGIKVMVDHHLDPDLFCDLTFSRPEASSTCMLLFKLLCDLELYDIINRKAAECLLTGMMTDTGNFSYNSNDPEIYYIVSKLVECGADHDRLAKLIFDTFTADCLRLNAYAISQKMEVWEDMGAALITLSRKELNSFGYKPGYTEGLVNKPLAIERVAYSAFFREEREYIKVSMRSKGDFPCDVICREHFNGGGHRNAAGGEYHGTMEQAVETFRSLLKDNYQTYIFPKHTKR